MLLHGLVLVELCHLSLHSLLQLRLLLLVGSKIPSVFFLILQFLNCFRRGLLFDDNGLLFRRFLLSCLIFLVFYLFTTLMSMLLVVLMVISFVMMFLFVFFHRFRLLLRYSSVMVVGFVVAMMRRTFEIVLLLILLLHHEVSRLHQLKVGLLGSAALYLDHILVPNSQQFVQEVNA